MSTACPPARPLQASHINILKTNNLQNNLADFSPRRKIRQVLIGWSLFYFTEKNPPSFNRLEPVLLYGEKSAKF
jgi:hypothetical protein